MKELYSTCGQHGLWIQSFKVLRFGVVVDLKIDLSYSLLKLSIKAKTEDTFLLIEV